VNGDDTVIVACGGAEIGDASRRPFETRIGALRDIG